MKECREAGKKSEEGAGDEEEEGTDEQRSGVEHKGNGNGGNGDDELSAKSKVNEGRASLEPKENPGSETPDVSANAEVSGS